MFFGTPVWPIKWSPPYDKTIEKIASLGFKGVELIGWNDEAYKTYYTPETVAALKREISDLGLTLTNFNFTPEHLCSEDKALREANKDTYKRAVETAKGLGAKTLTSVSPYPFGFHSAYEHLLKMPTKQVWTTCPDNSLNRDWNANYELYVTELRECCQLAGAAGLKVLIEPHPYRWVNSAQSMLRLIEHVGADNLGFNFDPSHLFPSGDMPHATVYAMKGYLAHTHFSDNDSYTNAHWRPGKGKIDWHSVMQALRDIGYDYVISFELEDVPGAATGSVQGTSAFDRELKLSIKYIQEVCEELGFSIG